MTDEPLSSWTPELVHELQRMWGEGASTAEIGRRLGVTKNAVVGKAHRLKLSARPSPIKRPPEPRRFSGPACQWPVGDPRSDSFHFCGEEAAPGKPYCQTHCALAYSRPSSSDKAASVA